MIKNIKSCFGVVKQVQAIKKSGKKLKQFCSEKRLVIEEVTETNNITTIAHSKTL